jgi:RNA polymerase sigma-B factor
VVGSAIARIHTYERPVAMSGTAHVSNLSTSEPDAQVSKDPLLRLLADLSPGDPRRPAVRERAIQFYLPLARNAARRYAGRGEPLPDLVQVAVIGLIKAVDRFDIERGVPFACYATPTILGEIKRYFRDYAWVVRVPRGLQELSAVMATTSERLAHGLLRTPSVAELAAAMKVGQADLLAVRSSAHAYRPCSLDQTSPSGEGTQLADSFGAPDRGFDSVIDRETLRLSLAELSPRERHILGLRFAGGLTQAQIAADIGVSQMQISRLLNQTLARLRVALSADVARHERSTSA